MIRNFRESQFASSEFDHEEDADPRVGLVNLADVMLVFACGLMLALVAYWNLDVSAMKEVVKTDQVTEVQNVDELKDSLGNGGGFVELGKVYQDPMTGKYYMLQEDMDKGQSPGGQGASSGNETENGTGQSAASSGDSNGSRTEGDAGQGAESSGNQEEK